VASGCQCWDSPGSHPYTFGWQTDYVREGKVLGSYLKQAFAGKKIAYFYQNDDFGQDGVKGLDNYIPASSVVSRQTYQPGNTDIGPQVAAINSAKADVAVLFTIPAYTALFRLNQLKLGNKAQLVVSNVGSDPTTLTGLLEAFAKQGGTQVQGNPLIQGMITDSYLVPIGDTTSSWYALFKKVHDQYVPNLPLDGNVGYGFAAAYTFVQALQAAGRNPTRRSLVDAVDHQHFTGPGLVPYAFSAGSHAGFTGVQVGVIKGDAIVLQGQPYTTDDGGGALQPYTASPPQAPANGIPPG
jgi:ABC-type branched-subunit amino acid transport system substrate-binding protein